MTKLRVGVVGLGVGRMHIWAYQQLAEQFEVVAACDIHPKARASVEKHQGVPSTYETLGELLEREAPDVVSLCTPPHLHLEQCRQALEARAHVVCEKPLVTSLGEVDALARDEARSGSRLMPVLQYRFGAGVQRLRHLIDAGVTGRAYLSTVETAWLRGDDYYAVPWRGHWESEGGGVLLSHASHAHDLLCFLQGDIRSVFARTATRVNPIETEDCAGAVLEMTDGSISTLAATLGSHAEISRLRFCFENLTAESSLSPYAPGDDPWTLTPKNDSIQAAIDDTLRDFRPPADGYVGQFAAFADALQHDRPFPVTIADARRSLELVTALYHSEETRAPVTLPLGPDHPKYAGWLPTEGEAEPR